MLHKSKLILAFMFIAVFVLIAASGNMAQAVGSGLNEPFDDSSQFTTNSGFFSDGGGDYFGLTGGTTDDFGSGSTPSALKAYTGFTGGYMTGMDLDGDQSTLPVIVDWTGIDISGLTSLEFSGDFAEYFDDPGDIDVPDFMYVEYQIDGAGFQKILQFSAMNLTNDPYNGFFGEDSDFNGVGDGALLGNAAQTFTKAIPSTGSILDLRLTVSVDSGDEDFGIDNFTIAEGAPPAASEILLTEIVVTPTGGEFVEIHNPTAGSVDLSDYYLTDATYSGGGDYYYNIVSATHAGGGGFGDFHARFPDGATIASGEYQTIAMAGSTAFNGEFGIDPTYELFEDDASPDAVPDMREALTGSIAGQGGLSDAGEVVVLYHWDGATDLVTDMDYAVWGDKAEAVDKTGISTDGPDPDADATAYLPDTAIVDQDVLATGSHSSGSSWQRDDLTEGAEAASGGNGVNGENETSEDLSVTWCEAAATPGAASVCPVAIPDIIINELDADQISTDSAEFIELFDGGSGNTNLTGLSLVLYNGSDDLSYLSFDLDGQTTDGDGYFVLCGDAANVTNCDLDVSPDTNLIQNGEDAAALIVGDAADYPNDSALPSDGDIVDAIVYETGSDSNSGLLVLLNAGQAVVDEDSAYDSENHSNQRCPNGEGGPRNTDTYLQDTPTPGADNECGSQPLPLSENFDDCTLAGWEIISVDSDQAHTWYCSSSYSNIEASGYGDSAPADEWLITPPLDLDAQGRDTLTFRNYTNYTDGGTPHPQLSVLYSTDYDGGGDPSTATWVELTGITFSPEDSGDWVDSGEIDLSGITGSDVYVAFHYTSSGTSGGSAATWRLDSIEIFSAPVPFVCADPATLIHEVQGNGLASPMDGIAGVIIEGVVVGDYQTSDSLSGFFLQEEDGDADADSSTSEGIFVYDGSTPAVDVNIGDVVRVEGTVDEFFDLTELTNLTNLAVCSSGASVSPAAVSLPVISVDAWEAVEGMQVAFNTTLTVNENYSLGQYGELTLSNGRLFQFTHSNLPDVAGYAAHVANLPLNQIILNDAKSGQNPDPIIYPDPELSATNTVRSGSTVDLTGVMNYSFGSYRVEPVGPVTFTGNTRTAAPDAVGGTINVASFNVLNYFTTIDTGSSICGPAANQGCRGADSASEFTRQKDKIVNAIVAMDADVVGLMEIENHATDAALIDLVAGLNAVAGAGTYEYIDTGFIGTDAIKVAFIYQPAAVTPVGSYAILDTSVDPTFLDTKNRPVLAQTFMENATGGKFTAAVNHLKSKGSDCNDVGDPDKLDGQGNCSTVRADASTAMVNWLATDPTGSLDTDFLIIGDLNSYAMEDAVTNLENGGYTNLLEAFDGTAAYSYIFKSESGYLDHALSSANLTPQVSGATAWHINTDEPRALDYNEEFKSAGQIISLYADDAYRASDHDPIIVGLTLDPPDLGSMSIRAYYKRAKLVYNNINGDSSREWVRIGRDGIVDGDKLDITAGDGKVRSSSWYGFGVSQERWYRWLVNGEEALSFKKDDSADGVFNEATASFYVGWKRTQTIEVQALLDGVVQETYLVDINSRHSWTPKMELPVTVDFDELVFSATGNGAFGVRTLNLEFENNQFAN